MADSKITFYKNVPLDQYFQDTRYFTSKADQDRFFKKFEYKTVDRLYYQRIADFPIKLSNKQISYTEGQTEINYIKIDNSKVENDGRVWYAFYDNCAYINDNTNNHYFTIDPIQTFMFQIDWDYAVPIERAHVNDWRRVTNDTGDPKNGDSGVYFDKNYGTVTQEQGMMVPPKNVVGHKVVSFNNGNSEKLLWVVVRVAISVGGQVGDIFDVGYKGGLPVSVATVVYPFNQASGKTVEVKSNKGTTIVTGGMEIFDIDTFMATDNNFTGTGNKMLSKYITEYVGLDYSYTLDKDGDISSIKLINELQLATLDIQGLGKLLFLKTIITHSVQKAVTQSTFVVDLATILFKMDPKLAQFSKLYDSDIINVIFQNNTGQSFLHNYRMDQSFNLNRPFLTTTINRVSAIDMNRKVGYWIDDNGKTFVEDGSRDMVESLAVGGVVDDQPWNLPIVNDSETMYNLAHKNSIDAQKYNAQLGYENNQIQIDASQAVQRANFSNQYDQQAISYNRTQSMTDSQAAQGYVMAVKNGFAGNSQTIMANATGVGLASNAMNAASAALTTGINYGFESDRNSINNDFTNQSIARQQANDSQVLGINNSASQKIASNSLNGALASINAGIADAKNANDNVSNIGNTPEFNFANNMLARWSVRYMLPPKEILYKIANYYNLAGYAVNGQIIPMSELLTKHKRTRFNYIKTTSATIRGNLNNYWRSVISTIFNAGIRLWHIDEIGDYSIYTSELNAQANGVAMIIQKAPLNLQLNEQGLKDLKNPDPRVKNYSLNSDLQLGKSNQQFNNEEELKDGGSQE